MTYNRIIVGDVRTALREIEDGVVQTVVTSPPYFGLRDYGDPDQIGLEPTPADYVAEIVNVFREVWRVLRDDGTVWLNLGDSYASAWACRRRNVVGNGSPDDDTQRPNRLVGGLKEKDLIGIPWMTAFALRDDGWYLRSEVIWHKPNPMPEAATDRPSRDHEQVFLLTKNAHYFYDDVAVQEQATGQPSGNKARTWGSNEAPDRDNGEGQIETHRGIPWEGRETRNKRTVWSIPTKPFRGAHFATMPPRLAETCVLAGSSSRGCCPVCSAPIERVVERTRVATRPGADTKTAGRDRTEMGNRDPERHVTETKTIGWRPTCGHREAARPVGCLVLDPFMGSGTTGLVAAGLRRQWLGVELNPEYARMAEERIGKAKAGLFSR